MDWLSPNPFSFFGNDFFVEEVDGPHYDYFKECGDAYNWALRHRPANVYKIPKGAEFYGEKDTSRTGNATLLSVVA